MAWSNVRAEGTCFLGFSVSSCPIAPSLQYSIIPLPPPLLHSPEDSLQPFPPFSSVWGGGRLPPRESGRAERTECEQRLESILRSFGCRASAREPHPTERGRVEGTTGLCPRDFPAATGARKAKERQRTMRNGRNTGTGTGNTTEEQG